MRYSELGRGPRTAIKIGIAALVWLGITVDDWSRDFTTNTAEISRQAADPGLKPLVSDRSHQDLVHALRWGARRIGGWEYVGQARDGMTTQVVFVRTSRIFRFKDDITLRIEEYARRRVIVGESMSRVGVGDLGQNTRNLRRILTETRAVLAGARVGPLT